MTVLTKIDTPLGVMIAAHSWLSVSASLLKYYDL